MGGTSWMHKQHRAAGKYKARRGLCQGFVISPAGYPIDFLGMLSGKVEHGANTTAGYWN